MKAYVPPSVAVYESHAGFPTVLAIAAASVVASAASIAMSKLVGDDRDMSRDRSILEIEE